MRIYSQAELERLSIEEYRKNYGRSAPKPVNLDSVLALDEPGPVQYRGKSYPVRLISYREGIELHRIVARIEVFKTMQSLTLGQLDEMDRFVVNTLDLFHSFLDPKPRENPFAESTPLEVGALLGFFSMRLTKQDEPRRAMDGGHRRSIS